MVDYDRTKRQYNGSTKRTKEIFEKIMTENFYRLMLDSKSQIQQTQRTSSGINVKKKNTPTFKRIIFKLNKIKDLGGKKKGLKKPEKKEMLYVQRNKYKNYIQLWLRW